MINKLIKKYRKFSTEDWWRDLGYLLEPDAYRVCFGDTVFGIAKKVFGDEHMYHDIIELNPDFDFGKLKIGDDLIVNKEKINVTNTN